jgi:hypothetical protein
MKTKLTVLLYALFLSVAPGWAWSFYEGDFLWWYTENSTTCELVSYSGSATHVVIPSVARQTENGQLIAQYTVTAIWDNAFNGYNRLDSVTIPNTVKSIGSSAFARCPLTSVTIPNSVTYIGNFAFRECANLASVIIGDSVTTIGEEAFAGCSSLTAIALPGSITTIGSNVFKDCRELAEVTVHWATPLAIEANTFTNVNLYEATLHVPAGTENIYREASVWKDFGSIVGDVSVDYSSEFEVVDGVLIKYHGQREHVTVPDNLEITEIGEYAFSGNESLLSISFPNTVTTIGIRAFSDCRKLTTVSFPTSLTTIKFAAFEGCLELTPVTIPATVTQLENSVFGHCLSLTSITVDAANTVYTSVDGVVYSKNMTILHTYPAGRDGTFVVPRQVSTIGRAAFYGCTLLSSSVILHDGITTIENFAFYSFSGLTSITIPASVTSIGEDLFTGCTKLSSITVDAANPVCSSDEGVFYNKDKTTLICYPISRSGEAFAIPATVAKIGVYAFWRSKLTSLTIPASVTSIDPLAFGGSAGLMDVTVYWPTPLEIKSNNIFSGVDVSAATLHVPVGTEALYREAPVWKDFKIAGTPTANESLPLQSLNIYTAAGSLHVNSATPCTLSIYTPAGTLVRHQTISAGETTLPHPRGLYIVRAGKEVKKVAIR